MSPYWSQERLFGHWGPTNRVVFRILILFVVVTLGLMGYYVVAQSNYNAKLDTYLSQARKNRQAIQVSQQRQIDEARAAARDVACFTVKYIQTLNPKARNDPFVKALSARYDCAHYVIPKHFPPVHTTGPAPGPRSTPTPSPTPSPHSPTPSRSTGQAAPGAPPSSQPRPRQSTTTRVVGLPGPTRTRTETVTPTPSAPSPTPTGIVPVLVCPIAKIILGTCPLPLG